MESPIHHLASVLLTLNSTQYTGVAFFLAICIPVFPRDTPLRYGFMLLQITCMVQGFIAPPPVVSNCAILYTSGVLMGNLLGRYIDRLYTKVPDESFHRILPTGQEDARKLSPGQRFLWSLELFCVTRGIGWNWQVAGIPKTPRQTRFQFVSMQLLRWVAMYAGLHLIDLACRTVLAGPSAVANPLGRAAVQHFIQSPSCLYVLIVLGWAMTIYSHFGLLMFPLSIICVGLQVGPRDWQRMEAWPPNFGKLSEAYSIRRFWGIAWHQQLRRQTGAPGAYLLSLLPAGVRKSSLLPIRLLRRYLLLVLSFVVSGFIHTCGSYNVTRGLGLPLSDGGELKYFTLQGMAIIVEDLVCWVLGIEDQTQQPPSAMRQWIGYTITLVWYVWTRVKFKAVPVALACGIRDNRGDLFAAVELVRRSATAVPGNFVALLLGHSLEGV